MLHVRWRFRPDPWLQSSAIESYNKLDARRKAMEKEARGKLGVFSEFAVADARAEFWELMGVRNPFPLVSFVSNFVPIWFCTI